MDNSRSQVSKACVFFVLDLRPAHVKQKSLPLTAGFLQLTINPLHERDIFVL
jgi:hypothetical protein